MNSEDTIRDIEQGDEIKNLGDKGNEENEIVSSVDGVTLTFDEIKFAIETKKGQWKTILDNVSGYVKPGQLLAVLGPSGSGKTTLLNVLSDRVRSTTNKRTKLNGEIRFNNAKFGSKTKKLSGFVSQDDRHISNLTVREILKISALLRLPGHLPREEKEKKVDNIIGDLGLEKVVDSVVGGALVRGISGGERKRLSVGVEMITSPYILFMDEPTSGLDSHMAFSLFEKLDVLKKRGRSIVATIHQPSSKLVEKFDLLLLLTEGRTVYFGRTGDAVRYFLEKCSLRCPLYSNPAEFFLDVCSLKFEPELEVGYEGSGEFQWDRAIDIFEAEKSKELRKEIGEINKNVVAEMQKKEQLEIRTNSALEIAVDEEGSKSDESDKASHPHTHFSTSFMNQFLVLSKRSFLSLIRDKRYFRARLFQVAIMSFLIGVIFFRLPYSQSGIRSRGGGLFFLTLQIGIGPLFGVLHIFSHERVVIEHERDGKWYGILPYFLSKSMSEVPIQIVEPILYAGIAYYLVGLNPAASRFFTFLGIAILTSLCSSSLGLVIASATPSFEIATIFASIFLLILILFSGFFVNSQLIPVWLSWIKWLTYLYYSFSIVINNEFDGESFYCTGSELGPGGVCPITTGQQALKYFGVVQNFNTGLYIGIIVVILFAFRLLTYLLLRYYRPKAD